MNVVRRTALISAVALMVAAGTGSAVAAPSSPSGRLFPSTPTTPEPARPAAAAAVVRAASTPYDVATYGYDLARTGNDPAETALGRSTVGGVTQLFQAGFANAGAVDAAVVAASGVVTPSGTRNLLYVGNEHGAFGAIDADTGAVVWEKNVGYQHTGCTDFVNTDAGVTASAVLDRSTNRVFVAGGDGRLYAFDMGTGAPATGWPNPVLVANPKRLHDYGGLNLDLVHHRIYVPYASYCDFTPYKGQVVSVDSSTGGALRRFVVVKDSQSGGGVWGWGGVSVDSSGNVYAATGNALPDGSTEATPYAEYVLKLSPAFAILGAHHPRLGGLDVDFGATPTLMDVAGCPGMLAAENKTGHLFVYRRGSIGAGVTQNITVVTSSGRGRQAFVGEPAYDPATQTMFIASPADGPLPHGMLARRFGANCATTPVWNTPAGPALSPVSTPTIADGVVYYADGTGRTVHAFDTSTGAQLWSSPAGTFTGDTFSAPVVFDGKVYVSSRGGTVHAFG